MPSAFIVSALETFRRDLYAPEHTVEEAKADDLVDDVAVALSTPMDRTAPDGRRASLVLQAQPLSPLSSCFSVCKEAAPCSPSS